jgi:hypothetical protein
MSQIIFSNGQVLSLADWQKIKGYSGRQLGTYFKVGEKGFGNKGFDKPFLIHELLFVILDALRAKVNKPVTINSAYRTVTEQKELRKTNKNAALNSPHTWGLAVDIDTVSNQQTFEYVNYLRAIAKDLGVQIRLGYKKYQNMEKPQTFIHLDVCPEMFGEGKVWERLPNVPIDFRKPSEW